MNLARLSWCLAALLAVTIGSCARRSPENMEGTAPAASTMGTGRGVEKVEFAGTGSCAGRACHGSIEPRDGKLSLRNEITTMWQDKHSQAFEALSSPLARQMGKHLDLKTDPWKASECLGCHLTPYASVEKVAKAERAIQEQGFGVGCESCHGSASKWVDLHTSDAWGKWSSEKKAGYGMMPVTDLLARAQSCVPCHVGASAKDGIPARDVNHDLIAAGHPRLAFELAVFLENLTPHWKPRAKNPQEEAQIAVSNWAVGQAIAGEAALDLLDYRATPKNGRPWPEFAELDCYACHHDLKDAGWRQKRPLFKGGAPGAFSWGTWYFSTQRLLAKELDVEGDKIPTQLQALHGLFSGGNPDQITVHDQVDPLRKNLETLAKKAMTWKVDHPMAGKLIEKMTDEKFLTLDSWDSAEQYLLACQVFGRLLDNAKREIVLSDLVQQRALSPPALFDLDYFKAWRTKFGNSLTSGKGR